MFSSQNEVNSWGWEKISPPKNFALQRKWPKKRCPKNMLAQKNVGLKNFHPKKIFAKKSAKENFALKKFGKKNFDERDISIEKDIQSRLGTISFFNWGWCISCT